MGWQGDKYNYILSTTGTTGWQGDKYNYMYILSTTGTMGWQGMSKTTEYTTVHRDNRLAASKQF